MQAKKRGNFKWFFFSSPSSRSYKVLGIYKHEPIFYPANFLTIQ